VIGKLIEPFFIVLLGLFVGFILVAMYLPMFEMSSRNF
jgi:type IV pilus assembly protein PilC